MKAFFPGFFLGLSLIVAIGAQNAFVLRQGLQKHHVLAVVLTCVISDAILIMAGVAGFGSLVKVIPQLETLMAVAGSLFLIFYALKSFWAAFSDSSSLRPSDEKLASLTKTIATCLAFTWLNPHVYLDTVVLLGSISVNYGAQRFIFGMGAVTASLLFFFSLGFGARLLTPLFTKPQAWKILDILIGIIMLTLALELLRRVL